MAITDIADVAYESWGGYDDPRLPSRIWKSKTIVTGDASGGNISAFARFNLAGDERLDQQYSLEEIWLENGGAIQATFVLQTRNFGSVVTGTRPITLPIRTIGASITIGAPQLPELGQLLPIFLGQQVFRSTALEIVVLLDNIEDEVSSIWLGGYSWGPRSVSAKNGGLVRPNPGLFTP